MPKKIDIMDALADLILQATTERSHYYVASVAREAAAAILALRARIAHLEQERQDERYAQSGRH